MMNEEDKTLTDKLNDILILIKKGKNSHAELLTNALIIEYEDVELRR